MKTAIITGSAGNLGEVVTNALLDAGYKVEATVLNEDELNAQPDHPNLNSTIVDLMNEEAAGRYIDAVIERNGTVDVAILLVGGFAMGSLKDAGNQELDHMLNLNFKTAYFTARPVFQHMKDKGIPGRLVVVGAKPALEPTAAKAVLPYALSKSLVIRLAEVLNVEGKENGIVTSVIVPSVIDTPPNRESMPNANFSDWVKPESIAHTILDLIGETGKDWREPVIKLYGNA